MKNIYKAFVLLCTLTLSSNYVQAGELLCPETSIPGALGGAAYLASVISFFKAHSLASNVLRLTFNSQEPISISDVVMGVISHLYPATIQAQNEALFYATLGGTLAIIGTLFSICAFNNFHKKPTSTPLS